MREYLFKSKKFFPYSIFVILDALNISYMAILLKDTLDAATEGSMEKLKGIMVTVILFMIYYTAVSLISRTLKAKYISQTMLIIKQNLMNAILNNNITGFYKKNNSDYISTFNNDLKIVETNYFESFFKILSNLVTMTASLIMMLWISPAVSLVAVILSFFPFLVPKLCGKILSQKTAEFSSSLKEYNGKIINIFQGYEVIKSYAIEKYIEKNHEKDNQMLEQSRENMNTFKARVDVLTNFIAVGMQFSVFLLAGYYVIEGRLTAGDVIAITQLMSKVMNPIFNSIDQISLIKSVKDIQNNLKELLKGEKKGNVEIEPLLIREKISLENVSFTYPQTNRGIYNISMKIEKGKKYAIVGESGSGKTTILKLILGYYKADGGKILFDSKDLDDIKQDSIFQFFSVINQNVFLFDDTIKQNILLYKDYPKEHLEEIAEKVGLMPVLGGKEKNLNSPVTRNGLELSGGEKQKVALARALVKGIDWLIMDEATSNLDNETLLTIEDLLINMESISYIAVTHRYNKEILKKYDKIFVIKNGRLCEEGTFEELLKLNGIFYGLYKVAE